MQIFNALSIRARLALLAVASILGFSVLLAMQLSAKWDDINEARQRELRSLLESAVAVAADLNQQVVKGVLPLAEAQTQARQQIARMRYRGSEYFFITDFTPVMIMHPIRPELDGKDVGPMQDPSGKALFREFVKVTRESGGGFVDYLWPRPGSTTPVAKISYVQGFSPWGWIIGTGVYTDDLSAEFWNAVWAMAINMGIVMAVIIAATVMLIRSITLPLGALNGALMRLADNDIRIDIPGIERRDEIGAMAGAVEVLRRKAVERERLEEENIRQHASREARQGRIEHMIDEFRHETETVLSAVMRQSDDLQTTARTLTDIAQGASQKASSVTTASEQASENVGTVAAASEELARSIDEIAQQISRTSHNVGNAAQVATNTNSRVAALADAARSIGEVVVLIQQIASQTNLLALNATIEAARAGEAGRGFAVVAAEVKNLAEQTAKATETITSQIAGIQGASEEAVASIEQIAGIMDEVHGATTSIAAAVEEQQAVTTEISRNVHQAANSTRDVAGTIRGVSAAAVDTSQSAGAVLRSSEDVRTKTTDVKGRIERFLERVRAA
jgi:methyl-accepting chemotaxis protein